MDKRLKEFAAQAGFNLSVDYHCDEYELERFAELVRQDEREACAVLVEADGRVHPKAPDAVWAKTVAKLIRAKGNHG